MAEELGFFEAMRAVLTPLTSARSLFSILEQAERQGMLTALRDGATPGDVARAVKVSEDWVDAVCAALVVNGVAESDSGKIRLKPPWRALTADDAFQPLRNVFAQSRSIDMMLSTRMPPTPPLPRRSGRPSLTRSLRTRTRGNSSRGFERTSSRIHGSPR